MRSHCEGSGANSTFVASHSSFCAYSSDNAARHSLHVSKSLVLCFRQGRDDLLEPLSPVCLAHVTPLAVVHERSTLSMRYVAPPAAWISWLHSQLRLVGLTLVTQHILGDLNAALEELHAALEKRAWHLGPSDLQPPDPHEKKKASNSYISSVLVLLCMNVRVETPVARDARKEKKIVIILVYI
jgi:hypothetical protein